MAVLTQEIRTFEKAGKLDLQEKSAPQRQALLMENGWSHSPASKNGT
jgi:hypothetical protein